MLFNSISYLIFFPIVFVAYWLSPSPARRWVLLAGSYFFYMSWIPAYGLLLFSLTVANYFLGLALDRLRSHARLILVAGLVVNLGALCFFKYTNFLLSSLSSAFRSVAPWFDLSPDALQLPVVNVILPLGISFFVFEFIHYLTDIYRGDRAIRSPLDFGLFAAFFPSQIAGPIKRYQDFTSQLAKPIFLKSDEFHRGLSLLLQGLFKKVALSDNLAPLVAAGFGNATTAGTVDAWLATLAFALQIYFDFSGYTDMGRGSAMMLGFSLPDNFNLPYIAYSLRDFWKRWHISLSTWLRDYLYIPLGGGRASRWRKHYNLMVTMLLGGLWHGASWHFVAWGGFHGACLVVNHEYDCLVKKSSRLERFHKSPVGRAVAVAFTFLLVLVSWVLFRAESLAQAGQVLSCMFSLAPSQVVVSMLPGSTLPFALGAYVIYACLCALRLKPGLTASGCMTRLSATFAGPLSRVALYAGAFLAAIGFAPSQVEPFIYFQF